MSFKPTQEQENILKAFNETRVLKINAVAGSGKSSTLKLLAQSHDKPSLYICFNKINAEEARAKFPIHTDCKTTHSLAFPTCGKMIVGKLTRPTGRYVNVAGTSQEVAKYYNIKDFPCGDTPLTAAAVASLVKNTVSRYQNSANEVLDKSHTPMSDIKRLENSHVGLNTKSLTTTVLKYAKLLWKDRIDPYSPVLAHHDTYLKMYQLSNPILSYDIIYVDEAQDLNPVTLDIISRQTQSKIVFVGDTYQSIYAFRGAINALDSINSPSRLLSKSFRYGDDIARVATWIIGGEIVISGNETVPSKVCYINDKEYTMIFRTNSALLEHAVGLISSGKNVYCEVDAKGFIKKIESAQSLYLAQHKDVKHEDITPYSCWHDLTEAAKEDPELKRIAKIVQDGKAGFFISHLSKLSNKPHKADITLTTAHKSKGMEWNNVVLADDYPLSKDSDDPFEKMSSQEINLLYVASTRAILKLQLPSSIMDDYLLSFGE
jgi:hypothetical protein